MATVPNLLLVTKSDALTTKLTQNGLADLWLKKRKPWRMPARSFRKTTTLLVLVHATEQMRDADIVEFVHASTRAKSGPGPDPCRFLQCTVGILCVYGAHGDEVSKREIDGRRNGEMPFFSLTTHFWLATIGARGRLAARNGDNPRLALKETQASARKAAATPSAAMSYACCSWSEERMSPLRVVSLSKIARIGR